jgi:hypothetical protein
MRCLFSGMQETVSLNVTTKLHSRNLVWSYKFCNRFVSKITCVYNDRTLKQMRYAKL